MHLSHPEKIDTPSLLVFPKKVQHNIQKMVEIAGDKNRLRPHVKTHKMAEVAQMHVAQGIQKFKCATIAEAEMLAQAGAKSILLAHQPVGPKMSRLVSLAVAFPNIKWACIVDDPAIVDQLIALCQAHNTRLNLWIDLDNGMHRSGISPGEDALALCQQINDADNVQFGGIHAYDGHFRAAAFNERKADSDNAFKLVLDFKDALNKQGIAVPEIVAGGSPTFPVHALRDHSINLSPGTYVFWDAGYGGRFADMPFEHAALVATRIISKPGKNRICLDLGHKSIASENPIDKRVRILGHDDMTFVGHSEEHLVVEVEDPSKFAVGDLLLGIPWHICPTVALHQQAYVIEDGEIVDNWKVVARDRVLAY